MPDFEIRISTPTDLSGSKATDAALEKNAESIAEVGEAAAKSATQQEGANQRVIASTNQAAGATEKIVGAIGAVAPAVQAGMGPLLEELQRIVSAGQAAGASLGGVEARLAAMHQQSGLQGQAIASSLAGIDIGVAKLHEAALAAQELQSKAQQAGAPALKPLANSAAEAKQHLSDADHALDHLISSLKTGISIDLGHRLIEGLAEVPTKFREALAEGVQFNATMETMGISLAAAFMAAEPSKYLNFGQAQQAGSEALDLLRAKANALGLDFHALGESLSINLATLAHAGVTDIQQQIDLITLLQQVTAAKGISGFQATRDIIDLLNGQANRTMLGKELEPLGVNNETLKAAKEQGQLYEFLASKFGAYMAAAAASADTFSAAQIRLKNETEQLYGQITKPVFEEMKTNYQLLAEELKKPEVAKALRKLGLETADVVKVAGGLTRFAVEHSGALVKLAEVIGLVTLAFTLNKAAALLTIIPARLGFIAEETAALSTQTGAIAANTAARTGLFAKMGVGSVIGNAGTIAAVGVGSFMTGRAIREAWTHEQADGQEEIEGGEAAQKNTGKIGQLSDQIRQAQTLEEKERANKDLAAEIAAISERITELKKKDSPVAQAQAQLAQEQLRSALHLQETFNDIAGTRQKTLTAEQHNADALERQKDAAKELAAAEKEIARSEADIAKTAEKRRFDALSPQDQASDLQRQRAELVNRLNRSDVSSLRANAGEQSIADYQRMADRPAIAESTDPETAKKRAAFLSDLQHLQQIEGEQEKLNKQLTDTGSKQQDADKKKADALADANRKHGEAAADLVSQLNILRAQLAGNDELVKSLKDEQALRAEIRRLIGEGFADDGNTRQLAAEKVTLERQIADEKERQAKAAKDTATADQNDMARRPGESGNDYLSRTGRIDAHAVDTDPNGGLHTGGLETGRLTSGNPKLVSTAGASLENPAAAGFGDPSSIFSKPFSVFAQSPTAGAGFAPAASAFSASPASGNAAGLPQGGGDNGLGAAAKNADQAAGGAQQAANSASQAMQGAVTAIQGLGGKLRALQSELNQLRDRTQTLEQTVADIDLTI